MLSSEYSNDKEEGMKSQGPHQGSESAKERAEIVSRKLSREEREDLVCSLEHICTVGSSNRHATKRVREWEDKIKAANKQDGIRIPVHVQDDQEDLQVDESSGDNEGEEGATDGNATSSVPPAYKPLPMMHAEDVRIYGKHGYPQQNWPTRAQIRRNDVEWDKEYGDCIHPLAFLEAKLSNVPPLKRQRVDGPNLSIDKTNPTVAFEDVPRAMLARCWERAVHAASTRIDCDDSSLLNDMQDVTVEPHALQDHAKYSVDNATKKCKDLNIQITAVPDDDEQTCPACGAVLESNDDLLKHYYGRPNQQRGCCWTKIRTTQYNLLDQMLQQEVKESATGLAQIVMSSLDKKETPPTQHWQDIIHLLETACKHARVQIKEGESSPSMLETMQYEPRRGRLVLNPSLLRNTKKRLVDRYANLPK